MANPTFGNAKGRTLPDSQTGESFDSGLDFAVQGSPETQLPWDTSHPDCSDASGALPAVTHLGSAGGGHDDPSASAGRDPHFDDVGSVPPLKGGNLGPF